MSDVNGKSDRVLLIETHDAVIEHIAIAETVFKTVAQHDKILDGNAGNGLRTRMTVAENRLGDTEGALGKLRENKTKWFWLFVGAAMSLVVTVLGSLSVAIASGVFR